MATYTVRSDGETWQSIAGGLGIPRDALLRANCREPSEPWPNPDQGDELALPTQPEDAAIAPENDHTIDLGGEPTRPFDVPPQKQYLPDQPPPSSDWGGGGDDDGNGNGPMLVAANDDGLVRSLIDMARKSNDKRDQDTTVTRPGGHFVPVGVVTAASRPSNIALDHGFLDDGHGNLDNSKRRAPTVSDYAELAKWEAILAGAQVARPDLDDATTFYAHFLIADGTPMEFSYDKYADDDRAGALSVASAIEDIRAGAIELHENRGMTGGSFVIQTQVISVGAFVKDPKTKTWRAENNRYPYPGTEDWQKTIGAHVIWLVGLVDVDVHTTPNRRAFSIDFTLHAEDRYNFNPGNADIASGALDAENGVFEVTGLGKEFDTFSTLTRKLTFSLPLAAAPDFRARPADFATMDPHASRIPGDPGAEAPDGGLPPGGI